MRLARVLATVAAVAGGAFVSDAQAAKVDCRRAGETVAAGRHVRVYNTYTADGDLRLVACELRTRRARTLGQAFTASRSGGSHPTLLALNGRYVATAIQTWTEFSSRTSGVRVLNVGTGKRTGAFDTEQDVAGLALTADGRAVWTAKLGEAVEVHALTGSGMQVLDAAPGIEHGSTALSRSRAYWMRSGAPVSTQLQSR